MVIFPSQTCSTERSAAVNISKMMYSNCRHNTPAATPGRDTRHCKENLTENIPSTSLICQGKGTINCSCKVFSFSM